MRISTYKKRPQNVFTTFIDLMGIKYTNRFSDKYFNEHPHKYNLFGLSKMLTEYRIENAAIRMKDKVKGLPEAEVPFVAHIGMDFVVVTKTDQKNIYCIWNGKNTTISLDEFYKMWSGVILVAEPDNNSKEPDYKRHIINGRISFFKETSVLTLSIILLLCVCVNNIVLNIGSILLLLFNLTGAYISYLLLQKQLKAQSAYVDKICSLFKQGDCNDVLESDAAKLLGILSWSEIGFGYFIANSIILLFFPYMISDLAFVNICALPYTLWSVWYQKNKAKQWCPLCLFVQGLIWIIFTINVAFGFISLPLFDAKEILIMFCLFSISILITNLLVSSLSQFESVEQIKQEINSLKATDEVFKVLLKKQSYYNVSKDTSKILFGNLNASTLITVLTNPHCNPCSKMHKRINHLLSKNNDLCIQYIFSSFGEKLNSSNEFLISAYINMPEARNLIFDSWFESGKNDKETFWGLYHLHSTKEVQMEFQKHENWKQYTGIRATPTILVNGYKLPDNYKIEDLIYFSDLVVDTK